MEFEEMQMIWDSQNEEPLYAINRQALHARIKEKRRAIETTLYTFEWILIIANLLAGLIILLSANEADYLLNYVTAVGIFGLAGYMYWVQQKRKQNEQKFDDSLLGDIDKGIMQVEYQIQRSRTLLWWCVLPATIIFSLPLIGNFLLFVMWAVMAGSYALSYWQTEKEIRAVHLPRKQELESLRKLLLETDLPMPD